MNILSFLYKTSFRLLVSSLSTYLQTSKTIHPEKIKKYARKNRYKQPTLDKPPSEIIAFWIKKIQIDDGRAIGYLSIQAQHCGKRGHYVQLRERTVIFYRNMPFGYLKGRLKRKGERDLPKKI